MNAIVIFLGRTLGRPSCKRLRDGSLFTAWGGRADEIGGDDFIFGGTKGGISPKGGSPKTLEGFRGGTTQICLENKDMWGGGGGSRKSSKVIRGDHFSVVTFKGGIG